MCRVAALQAGLAGQGWRQVEEDTRLHGLVRCQAILSMASEPRPSQGAGGAGGGGPEVPRHAPPPHPGGRGGGPGGPGWWLLALQKPFICLKFSRLTNTRAKGSSSLFVMKVGVEVVSLRLRGELEWVEGRLLEEWGGLLAAYHRYRVQPHGSGPLLKVFGLMFGVLLSPGPSPTPWGRRGSCPCLD